MKNIKWVAGTCLLAFGLGLCSSCSDDDQAVAPVFPEKVEELTVNAAGDMAEFSFTANEDWTLTSSRLWCKFIAGKEQETMLVGTAGEHKVQVVVTDDIWNFEAATAEISLNMGGQSQVVAKVTRGPKGLEIEGLGPDHPITITYGAGTGGSETSISVKANFDWELNETGVPEWLSIPELPIKGKAGRMLDILASVKSESKISAQHGELCFVQTGATQSLKVPVNYTGMGERDIEISLSNVWGWNVSKEGDVYWRGSLTGAGDEERLAFPLKVHITAKDNEYTLARLFVKDGNLQEPDSWNGGDFFTYEDDAKGNLTINAVQKNSKGEREGYILAFPNAVYEKELEGDVNNAVDSDDWSSLKEEYTKYVAFNFIQESAVEAASGFEVLQGGFNPVDCAPGDNGTGIGEMITGVTGVQPDNIYFVKVSKEVYLQVNPMLTPEQWNPMQSLNGMTIQTISGEDCSEGWTPGMNMNEQYVMEGMVNETMFISFPDLSMGFPMPAKALLIIVEE